MLLKITHSNSSINPAFQFASQTKYEKTKNKTIPGWLSGSWMMKQGPAKAIAEVSESTEIQCREFGTGVRPGLYEKPCASTSWKPPTGSVYYALSKQITLDTHPYLVK
jgi:hypothetical protein